VIYTQLTNGFGNNLFQCVASRLLASFLDQEVTFIPPFPGYYGATELEKVGFPVKPTQVPECQRVNDVNYTHFFNKRYSNSDLYVSGYFENYKFYKNNIDLIKTWFRETNDTTKNDLVMHFRAGDRLFYANETDSKPKAKNFVNAIEQFDFEKLHIVTDMPYWTHITVDELENMKFHVDVPVSVRADPQESVDYFNSMVDAFAKYDPQVEKRTVSEDFNFIRGFENILFQHGTMAWWAAVVSDAKKVGVYGPWRPWKGDTNKNLSNIGLEGWFKWT
tara:strand:+ start:2721 stop:3548 length:828 start_codon:yes stop_codon:yes gene_type:complete